MRLIDADALKEIIGKYEFTAPNERYKQGGECVLNFYMPKIIDNAPTIDAEPVRCGKWIEQDDGSYYTCSFCKNEWITLEGNPIDNNMKYCPQCGAKMDGGISYGIDE